MHSCTHMRVWGCVRGRSSLGAEPKGATTERVATRSGSGTTSEPDAHTVQAIGREHEYEYRLRPGSGKIVMHSGTHVLMGPGPHERRSGPSAHRLLEVAVFHNQISAGERQGESMTKSGHLMLSPPALRNHSISRDPPPTSWRAGAGSGPLLSLALHMAESGHVMSWGGWLR